MSQWATNYAILQDLSMAQGRGVPARMEGIVAGDERSLAHHILEGTENQHYDRYAADHTRAAQDLNLIQHMLQMGRVVNPAPQPQKPNVKASMLNPNCAEFVPQNSAKAQRQEMNVAMKSLLEADAERFERQNVRLLKPDDMMNNMALERQGSPSMPEQNNNMYLDVYQSSEYAKTKLKTYVKDEIWAKADRKLKETERRKQQSAQLCMEWGLNEDNQNLDVVRLPYHRHVIAEGCVVCDTVKKHSFDVNKFVPFAKGI